MAIVKPFRGLLYEPGRFADLSKVLAPPYDVIDAELKRSLHERDPHNVVRLILPEDRDDDGEAENRYTRGATALRTWREDGILVRDERPALYLYRQTYRVEGEAEDRQRDGIFAAVRLEDPDAGVVRPHERTLEGPKADRLKLTRATGANLSPIFGLFSDPDGEVLHRVRAAVTGDALLAGVDHDGIRHELWRLDDRAAISGFGEALRELEIFIADGHHRYATALNYRTIARGEQPTAGPAASFEHVLMVLTSMEDEGLAVLPIHRVLHHLPGFDPGAFLDRVRERVDVRPVDGADALEAELGSASGRPAGLLLRSADGGAPRAYVMDLEGRIGRPDDVPPVLWDLDVRRLHRWIIEEAAGVSPEAQARKEGLTFFSKAAVARAMVEDGEGDAALFLRSTRIEQVREVARAGEVMPQKSTFFYPKLASGMVLHPLLPAEDLG